MSRTVGIAGKEFQVDDIYKEEDKLNAAEANALNQMRAENIRNNLRNAVTEALKEGKSEEDLDALVAEYVDKYEFGARKGGGHRVTDPVEREMRNIAIEAVKPALIKADQPWQSLNSADRQKVLDKYWAKDGRKEATRALAIQRLDALKSVAGDVDVAI